MAFQGGQGGSRAQGGGNERAAAQAEYQLRHLHNKYGPGLAQSRGGTGTRAPGTNHISIS